MTRAGLLNRHDAFLVVFISRHKTLSVSMVHSCGYRRRFDFDGPVYDHQSRVECILSQADLH